MQRTEALQLLSNDIVREALSKPTVFKDEGPLSIEYIPAKIPHREDQLSFLAQLFRFAIEKPCSMSQKVLITGDIGTGKTVLSQRFGIDIMKAAKNRKVNLQYVHVNCRECRGSLFMVMKRVIAKVAPELPRRGFSPEELLEVLMDILDNKNGHLILALDEAESLIRTEGSTALYNLTRAQEERFDKPMRLSLICILRDPSILEQLDPSTLDTLQRNFLKLEKYSSSQLEVILEDRVELAFKKGAMLDDTVRLIADIAGARGDARYAIELLWRAGKYADLEVARQVSPEHVRKAVESVYPSLRGDYIMALSIQEKLIVLGLARALHESGLAYATMGDVEHYYKVACEEYGETPRGHTQVWKYARDLGAIGVISTRKSGQGMRGKTTLLGLTSVPAALMRERLEVALEALKKKAKQI